VASGWLAGVSDALVGVFFPAGCRICDRLLIGASRVPICGECVSLSIDPLGAWFAGQLAEVVHGEANAMAAEVVVPVPLHRQRERERGYNQAALLSRPLAKRLRLPNKAVLLMRTRARPDSEFSLWKKDGSPYVALLPHVQAPKLTIYASYW
jgi:hypothetical protein